MPTKLYAADIEDGWPDNTDEIQLDLPGGKYSTSIANHEAKWDYQMPESPDLAQLPGSTFNVTLYEWDGSTPRNLGTHTITWSGHSDGRSFIKTGDYSYQLNYRVDDKGGTTECVPHRPVPDVTWESEADARQILWETNRLQRRSGT